MLRDFVPSPVPYAVTGHTYPDSIEFEWSEGMPTPRGRRPMAKEQVQQIHHAAAALPYRGEWSPEQQAWIIDPKYEGKTMVEVAIIRRFEAAAAGDANAYKDVMDRVLGKPKQALESVNMNLSYTEMLDMLDDSGWREIPQTLDVEAQEDWGDSV